MGLGPDDDNSGLGLECLFVCCWIGRRAALVRFSLGLWSLDWCGGAEDVDE